MGIGNSEELPALDLGKAAEGIRRVGRDRYDYPAVRSEGSVGGFLVSNGGYGIEMDLRVGDGINVRLGLGLEAEEGGGVADVAEEEDDGDGHYE